MTLSRLVASHDAALTDLRGFSRSNQGCIFHLNELVKVVPLPKVVLTVDRATDLAFLHEILAGAWATMAADSPSRRRRRAQLAVRRRQRVIVGDETPNSRTTSARGAPRSSASSTRMRRSLE